MSFNLQNLDSSRNTDLPHKISNVHIHFNADQKVDISHYEFDNVTFSGHFPYSSFENVTFKNSTFKNADFSLSDFYNVNFVNSNIIHCNFNRGGFFHSTFNGTHTWDSDFSEVFFSNNHIHHSIFAKPKLDNAFHYENHIEDMHIVFHQPYDNPLPGTFGGAALHAVHPTIGLVSDTEWYSTPRSIINKYHGTPLTIKQEAPAEVDLALLKNEIQGALDDIRTHGLQEESIAQHILQSDQPTINKIKHYAYDMVKGVDAVWIPGGPDLHPEFYGEENTHSGTPDNYYREVLEFSLTEAALSMNKPLLGICHGSQLVNVYLGGTLHQHVSGQSGISPILDVHTHTGILGSAIDSQQPTHGPSFHHQAVKTVAPSLEVVATYQGVIKATQAKDDAKIMLCQFHPEYEHDQNSKNILKQFIQLGTEQKIKETTLHLQDILHLPDTLSALLEDPHSVSSAPLSPEHTIPFALPPASATLDLPMVLEI